MPQWGTSNECPQHMFSCRNKKKYLSGTTYQELLAQSEPLAVQIPLYAWCSSLEACFLFPGVGKGRLINILTRYLIVLTVIWGMARKNAYILAWTNRWDWGCLVVQQRYSPTWCFFSVVYGVMEDFVLLCIIYCLYIAKLLRKGMRKVWKLA